MPPLILRPTATNRMQFHPNGSNKIIGGQRLPAGGGGFSGSNEPSGMTVGFDEAWLTKPPTASSGPNWFIEVHPDRVSIIDDPTSPMPDHKVLQLFLPSGATGGVEPMVIGWGETAGFPANTGTLYMRMWVKVSSDWSNNGNSGCKFFWPRPLLSTTNHFVPLMQEDGAIPTSDVLRSGFNLQASYNGSSDFDYLENTTHTPGQWYDMEWLLYQGSSGAANNGTIEIWVDGIKTANYTGIKYLFDGETPGWKWMGIAPTFGYGSNPVPHDQYIWIDHFYASVK